MNDFNVTAQSLIINAVQDINNPNFEKAQQIADILMNNPEFGAKIIDSIQRATDNNIASLNEDLCVSTAWNFYQSELNAGEPEYDDVGMPRI